MGAVAKKSDAMPLPLSTSAKVLMRELSSVNEDPIEGFRILHVDDSNIFDWQIAVFGPPGTCYQGGYFKAHIRFPGDYPFSVPSFRFLTKIWHPNILKTERFASLFSTLLLMTHKEKAQSKFKLKFS